MRVLVVGDKDSIHSDVRVSLTRCGFECREDDFVSLDAGLDMAAAARRELILLVMSPHFERSIRALAEIRRSTRETILAVGPISDPKLILKVLREGADQYLDEDELSSELESALVNLKRRQSPDNRHGLLVSVLGSCGGCGTSTVASNIAAAESISHEPALLIDLSLESGDLPSLLDLQPSHSIADLCQNLHRLDESMFEQLLLKHPSGVHLLPAPAASADTSQVTPQGVRQALALARSRFSLVVVDTGRTLTAEQRPAILQSELLLLVVRLDMVSLKNAQRTIATIRELGMAQSQLRVIVNRFGQPKELSSRMVEQALGVKPFHTVPNDPANVNRSNNDGVPIVIQRPRAKAARSFLELARLIQSTEIERPAGPPPIDLTANESVPQSALTARH